EEVIDRFARCRPRVAAEASLGWNGRARCPPRQRADPRGPDRGRPRGRRSGPLARRDRGSGGDRTEGDASPETGGERAMGDAMDDFEERGYAVFRGLLTPGEVAFYRAEIQKLSGVGDEDVGKKAFTCADGVTQNRTYWPLIYHERVLEAVRSLIGPSIRYTQHSDLHAHMASQKSLPGGGVVGWHRDSACREFDVGPDWDESLGPYRIVRVAIYLQSHAESHSMLGVMPGSHRYEQRLTGNAYRLWSRLLDAEYRAER